MRFTEVRNYFLTGSLTLLLAVPTFAQYGGGGTTTGTGGTTGTYTAPKGGYGSSAGVAAGAAAAAGVGVAYLALRHHGTIVGCVEPSSSSSDGIKLMNEKDKNTYALLASNISLAPGERVALGGKKSKDDSGKPTFQVTKLVKDYGSCK
jgi:hypothetical protein